MPLRHQPPSLRKASMTVIANNFEQLCYDCATQQQMMQLIDSEEYLQYEGPFIHLPSSVLEELMEVISEIRTLHRKHLHMLLQNQIQNLNLSFGIGDTRNGLRFMMQRSPGLLEEMMEEMKHVTHLRRHHLHVFLTPLTTTWNSHGIGDQLVAFSLLTLRCKNLKKLNISYLRHMNPSILLNLVSSFSNLVSLNLRMTLTVDQVLAQIGRNCPNLVDLNLACTPISDRGLVQMCVAEDGRRTVQKLMRLIITETSVTKAGAAVVLQSLPNLREFDYDHIFDALELVELWDEGLEQRLTKGAGVRLNAETSTPPSRLKLTTLISAADYIDSQGLDAATRLCPDARTLSISNAWLQNESLYKFMVLENLESLSITNSEGLTLDFYEGILPLLSVCGHKLQNLILANFTSVDVTTIGKLCPELQNLALSNVAQYDPVGKPSPNLFRHLRALELWSDPQAELSPYLIKQLLIFCPDMRNLLFKGCDILTDELFQEIWQANPMVKLSHLTLDHCHHVSRDTLQYLLDVENELTVVRVWSCVKIKKHHYTELITYIREENMDIYFEWFEYDE